MVKLPIQSQSHSINSHTLTHALSVAPHTEEKLYGIQISSIPTPPIPDFTPPETRIQDWARTNCSVKFGALRGLMEHLSRGIEYPVHLE